MIRSVDIAWLTGLLEAEGMFTVSKSTVYRHTRDRLPRMRVTPATA